MALPARANTKLIRQNWDDLLRVAGSLHQGTMSASELMRSLLRNKRPSTHTFRVAHDLLDMLPIQQRFNASSIKSLARRIRRHLFMGSSTL